MTPFAGFAVFLGLTLCLLGGVVVTGLRGTMRLHIPLVAATLASLGTTIFFAERLGDGYDLEAAGVITPVHLLIAKITTVGYLLPVVTGIMALRDRAWKRTHFRVALAVLVATVLTAATGTLMLALAPKLPA